MLLGRYIVIASLLLVWLASCTTARKRAERSEAIGLYYEASERYQALYRKTSSKERSLRAYYAYRAAECNLRLRHLDKALHQYKQAERYGYSDSSILYRLAYTLHANAEYKDAKVYYERYLNYRPNDSLSLIGLQGIALAERSVRDSNYTIQVLEPSLSTSSDYAPTISPSGQRLYFLSRRGKRTKSRATGEASAQLYALGRSPQNEWSGRVDTVLGFLPKAVEYEGITLSLDGQQLYYIARASEGLTLGISRRLSTGSWGVGKSILLPPNMPQEMRHPSLNMSATRLYFTATTDSLYGSDIYYLDLRDKTQLALHRLPTSINTRGKEGFVYTQGDSTLYFSSDGHPSLGGFDVYRADMQSDGSWLVHHLPAPLNSHKDEIGLTPDLYLSQSTTPYALRSRGIIASSRDDSRGRPHLYEYREYHSTTILDGLVTDREGYGIGGATIRMVARRGEARELLRTSREDGRFIFEIAPSNEYILLASKPGYLSQYAEFTTEAGDKNTTITLDFKLAKRSVPEVLHHLYYAFDSDELLPESEATLQELYKLLSDNPEIRLQLSAHTDRRGSDTYNQGLALRRVERVRSWLVERGVAGNRLVAKAYGKERPYVVGRREAERYSFLREGQVLSADWVEHLSSPEEIAICDELNRRTEFLVLD